MISDSVLGQTIRAAFTEWDAQKAAGASIAERVANLTKTLKAAWPFTREWHYLCPQCGDDGLQIHDCPGDATCGRSKAHLPHDFGAACWCSAGSRFKAKERTEESAVETAARAKKQPTRFGR